jgi:hypothetical protein
MKPIWKKLHHADSEGDHELWLGIPSWDPENRDGKLSIKFAYRKNGRIPRTAPEVPEDVIVEMVIMLAEHGRFSREEIVKLAECFSRPRTKLGSLPPHPQPGITCDDCRRLFTPELAPHWCGLSGWLCDECAGKEHLQPSLPA